VIRDWFDPERVRRHGTTPDYRFSLANERTFLSWIRTGLALVAGGLVAAQFLPELPVPRLREALAVGLLVLGAAVSLRALNHWLRCERAIRLGQDLPQSRFPSVLALLVTLVAAVLLVVVVAQAAVG
jgi:putative membrane protein